VLDPAGRYVRRDHLASDVLVVDGTPLSGEDPRVADAAAALGRPTPEERATALGALGIGAVLTDRTAPGAADLPALAGEQLLDTEELAVVALRGPVADQDRSGWWVAGMSAAWTGFLGAWAAAVWTALGRVRRRVDAPEARQVTGE
jgi:hypothetical protein